MASIASARAPWHLRAVGLLGLAWNGFGVFDYIRTKTGGAQYLREFGLTQAQIDHMLAMPAWVTAVWALGVFSALAATLLLLLRRRHAAPMFAASLGFYLLSLVHTYLLSDGAQVMESAPGGMAMQLVVLAGCLFFAWYSRRMAALGVLR
jgi:hypothetical protein